MHTAVGNDMNKQMIVNNIDNFYLAITINRLQYDSFQTLIIIYLIRLL